MRKYPDMDEMIRQCEEKKTEDEVIVFALGAGRTLPVLGKTKAMIQAIDIIKKTEGFLGINSIDLWHTLLLYDTLNNAKGARNDLEAKGVQALGQIVPVLIPKQHYEEVKKFLEEAKNGENI